MFTSRDKQKYDEALDSFDDIGSRIGTKINKGWSWTLRAISLGTLVLIMGSLVFVASLAKKSIGRK